ncbi:MAG: AbrB/MazE/SpoVT family DNA-binding domain-containing protein [Nitrososphaerota archaeon]|nr:AbrB/MazE/SpoVT family DNA-binding domain-containing protein [Nitrososphaerota archaeon]MDG7023189.1 AbrB/MazE/SpoVT family DNA-binding domain-containing protein [Nitrososphaerota archaeon]
MDEEPIIDVTKVSDKGQVVIPKQIRDKFHFTEGSRLIVLATEDAVVLRRVETVLGVTKTTEQAARVRWLGSDAGARVRVKRGQRDKE